MEKENDIEKLIEKEYSNKTIWERNFIYKSMKRYGINKYTYYKVKESYIIRGKTKKKKHHGKVTVTCKIHGDFEIDPDYFINSKYCYGCPMCNPGKTTKSNLETFIKRLNKINPNYVIIPGKTVYTNNNTPLWLHCNLHDVDFCMSPNNLLLGKTGCKQCYTEKIRNSLRVTASISLKNKIEKSFPNKFDFSKFNYINLKTKVILICKECGLEFQISPDLIERYINNKEELCPNERRNESSMKLFRNRYNIDDNLFERIKNLYPEHTNLDYIFIYKSILVWGENFIDYSKVSYVNESTPVILIKKNTSILASQTPDGNLSGRNPFGDSMSSGELLVNEWLTNNNLSYKYRDLLKNYPIQGREENSHVEIDFTLTYENKIIWIEYNGIQHYKLCRFFHTEDDFMKQQKRDNNVRKYCKENDILLIEIPWTYNNYEEINNILSEIIFNNKPPKDIIYYE